MEDDFCQFTLPCETFVSLVCKVMENNINTYLTVLFCGLNAKYKVFEKHFHLPLPPAFLPFFKNIASSLFIFKRLIFLIRWLCWILAAVHKQGGAILG